MQTKKIPLHNHFKEDANFDVEIESYDEQDIIDKINLEKMKDDYNNEVEAFKRRAKKGGGM